VLLALGACERAEAPVAPPPKIVGSDGRIVQECKTPDHAPLYIGKKVVDFCAFAAEDRNPRGVYTFTSPEKADAVWGYYRKVADDQGLAIEDEPKGPKGERIFSARGGAGRTLRLTLGRRKGLTSGKVEWRGS